MQLYLLLGLFELLLELLAMGTCTQIKLIVLSLYIVEKQLCNFLLLTEATLLNN